MSPLCRTGAVIVVTTSFIATRALLGQQAANLQPPRLWSDRALSEWATPIAGVNERPHHYSEAEYYAAPVTDEVRTYPVYRKYREPEGYRAQLVARGAQPLIQSGDITSDSDWVTVGRRVFEEMDFTPDTRTDDPRVLAWLDDPGAAARDGAVVTADGIIPSLRWVVEGDGRLKLGLEVCGSCHTRVMPDGTSIHGAQGNLNLAIPPVGLAFEHQDTVYKQQGRYLPPAEFLYWQWGAPWVKDDIHARIKTMSLEELGPLNAVRPGTFPRFNGSPFFMTKMPDLIGVKDRHYLDATGSHLNRGPEDLARYAILVSSNDDGSVGSHRFVADNVRKLTFRHSDAAMYALARYIHALEPPPNPNLPTEQTAMGGRVFAREGCAGCHTPPFYTNNKLTAVDGFSPTDAATASLDIMRGASVGTDTGLALRTRKGTGYYKVPSLKGLWYRSPLEHSGSVASLEEWFDPARLRDEYVSKGWMPPGVRNRAVPGHRFGLTLSQADKGALIAFLKTL